MPTSKPSKKDESAAQETVPSKRAFVYLRVSSDSQVNTGFDADGLSISAQREAAQDKATQLNAEIVREFSDPGKSAFADLHKRTDFLEMLDELTRCNQSPATHIDYVIVWALNRWARNVQDHHRTHELVRRAGARIVSITEPMVGGDESPESFFMEGMFALNNQYESMKTGRNVSRGMHQKAKAGGSYGPARIGYVNEMERLPDGRLVRSIGLDPERSPFIKLTFKLYGSGRYSVSQVATELYKLGLRTRPTKKRPAGKVSTTGIHNILRNPYYAGWIVYRRGTPDEQVFRGRHEALVDEATFTQVQALLDEKRVAGERPYKHQHYLKGSIFCGQCGKRLIYGISTGKTGTKYPYFFCAGRINGTGCTMRTNIPPKLIEAAVERYYAERPVQLSAEQVAERTEALEKLVAVSQQGMAQVKAAKTELIGELEAQQARLLRLHAEEGDSVSPRAFRKERQRLQTEIEVAEKSLAETEAQLRLDATTLRMALELAGDAAQVYREGLESLKRGYNQAFFTKLYVLPDFDETGSELRARVVDAELTEPYAVLLADGLAEEVLAEAELIRDTAAKAEGDPEGSPSAAAISNFSKLVPLRGFEPRFPD